MIYVRHVSRWYHLVAHQARVPALRRYLIFDFLGGMVLNFQLKTGKLDMEDLENSCMECHGQVESENTNTRRNQDSRSLSVLLYGTILDNISQYKIMIARDTGDKQRFSTTYREWEHIWRLIVLNMQQCWSFNAEGLFKHQTRDSVREQCCSGFAQDS